MKVEWPKVRNLQHSKFNFFLCKRIIVFDFLLFSLDFSFFFFGNFWQFGRLFFLPLVEFFGVDCNCILTPLLLAPVRCEVERAGQLSPRRDRKGGGVVGLRGVYGGPCSSAIIINIIRGEEAPFFFLALFRARFPCCCILVCCFLGHFICYLLHTNSNTHTEAHALPEGKKNVLRKDIIGLGSLKYSCRR